LAAAARISGIVIDDRARPVEGARVFLAESPVAAPDIALLTDVDGRFVLGAPAPGRYVVGSADDAGRRASAEVVVGAGEANVTLVLGGEGG
jgi:hypothetical protein